MSRRATPLTSATIFSTCALGIALHLVGITTQVVAIAESGPLDGGAGITGLVLVVVGATMVGCIVPHLWRYIETRAETRAYLDLIADGNHAQQLARSDTAPVVPLTRQAK